MKNINIVYFFSFNENKINGIKPKINKLVYSILTVSTNIGNNIKIFTDFDGYSILSILFPLNIEITFYGTQIEFKEKYLNNIKKPHIFIENYETLKIFLVFKESYVLKTNGGFFLNPNSINNNISDEYIEETLIDFYGSIYDKYSDAINVKIEQYNKLNIR